jgi:putative flippase GtrA
MHPVDLSRTVARVRLASVLPSRIRSLAPEAIAFGLIGAANAGLYFVIFNLTITIGAVKATLIANVITTTLAYMAHRYWTYRARQKSAVRREIALFVFFNLAGTLIQSGVVAIGKYGFGLNEFRDRIWFNVCTLAGIGLATLFRFWAYRTLVFRPHPADHALPTTAAEALAEVFEGEAEFSQLTAPLKEEMGERPFPAQPARGGTASATGARRHR